MHSTVASFLTYMSPEDLDKFKEPTYWPALGVKYFRYCTEVLNQIPAEFEQFYKDLALHFAGVDA